MPDEIVIIEGQEQAAADIAKWAAQLPAMVTDDLTTFGNQLVGIVYAKQPFDTGRLAGSAELVPPTQDTFFALGLGRQVEYAGWIEFGGDPGREYVPNGRTVWPTARDAQSEFFRLAEKSTAASIERFPWNQS